MSETRQYTIDAVPQMIHELVRHKFYGSIQLNFEAGTLVLIRKTETFKPPTRDSRNSRGTPNGRDY